MNALFAYLWREQGAAGQIAGLLRGATGVGSEVIKPFGRCWVGDGTVGVPKNAANVALELLDKELEKRNHDFVRYADDFMIIVNAKQSGERVIGSITHFIGRGSFDIAQGYQKSIELDHWIRRRLRMSY